MKKILNILKHNDCDYGEYPDHEFDLVPFPSQKRPVFSSDNLATVNRAYYLDDKRFKEALNSAESAWGTPGHVRDISWRLHVLIWAFSIAVSRNNKPVLVELGTGRGYMMRGLSSYYRDVPLLGYLFDSFTPNLPDSDQPELASVQMRFSYAQTNQDIADLTQHLNKNPNQKFELVKGILPYTLECLTLEHVDFLHVDLNSADAESKCLEKLDNVVSPLTIVVFDDTGAPGSEKQRLVHHAYADSKNKKLLYLPTGQSLIF